MDIFKWHLSFDIDMNIQGFYGHNIIILYFSIILSQTLYRTVLSIVVLVYEIYPFKINTSIDISI